MKYVATAAVQARESPGHCHAKVDGLASVSIPHTHRDALKLI